MRLVVDQLTALRSGRLVFEGVSFSIVSGEALAVIGANGAGKSTLLRMIAGLLPKESGTIRLDGASAEATLAEQCHYLGHRDALKPALTPHETLSFWQAILGTARLSPHDALERVGIGHAAKLPSAYLSAGQRRRLALARLLIAYRPLWLLDEPAAALDASSEAVFDAIVAEHLAAGGLVVAATHAPFGFACRNLTLGRSQTGAGA